MKKELKKLINSKSGTWIAKQNDISLNEEESE